MHYGGRYLLEWFLYGLMCARKNAGCSQFCAPAPTVLLSCARERIFHWCVATPVLNRTRLPHFSGILPWVLVLRIIIKICCTMSVTPQIANVKQSPGNGTSEQKVGKKNLIGWRTINVRHKCVECEMRTVESLCSTKRKNMKMFISFP